jgi:hypothetical protein
VINYRFGGLAEKIPETHQIVPPNRSKIRVRSIKGRGWALCLKRDLCRGFSAVLPRHKERSKVYKKVQGLNRQTARSSSTYGQERTGGRRRPIRPNRRRSDTLGARVSCGIGRADRGGLEDVLTTSGDRWEALDFEERRTGGWPWWPARVRHGWRRSDASPTAGRG